MSNLTRFQAFALLALGISVLCAATRRAESAQPKEKKESFAVVQVDAEYAVVRKAELKDFQKALSEKFAAAVKAHQQARKDAVKNKEKFTEPAPRRPKVRTLPKVFDSEEAASAFVQQLKEEEERKKAAASR